MKKRFRKILSLLSILLVIAVANTGCSAVFEQKKEEVLIPEYTLEDLPNGYYVKAQDTFYEPSDANKTYGNPPQNISPERVLWYTDNKIHIPDYQNGNQIIYRSSTTIPQEFILEGFEHVCDSVGVRSIRLNDAGNFVISGANALHPESDAYAKLSSFVGSFTVVLDNINGNSIQSRMINKTGSISGLKEGETYTLGFYIGTQYYEVNIKADTQIYCSKSIDTITRYELTKDGYLILKMPELLTPGLYDINNSGVISYGGVIQE